jgi:hypothetical protein
VVANDKLVGIITETDLLRCFLAKPAPELRQKSKTQRAAKSKRRR